MKRLTLTLDEEIVQWLRARAAEWKISVSRLVGDMLREKMREEQRYAEAMRSFVACKPMVLRRPGESYPSRDELYDRAGLRSS